ncbi:MAG: hypothetical protein L3K11_01310 [Thermoplasmata archaeon]|nr:hypothetical protein [Thermoplasmata archaeon]
MERIANAEEGFLEATEHAARLPAFSGTRFGPVLPMRTDQLAAGEMGWSRSVRSTAPASLRSSLEISGSINLRVVPDGTPARGRGPARRGAGAETQALLLQSQTGTTMQLRAEFPAGSDPNWWGKLLRAVGEELESDEAD